MRCSSYGQHISPALHIVRLRGNFVGANTPKITFARRMTDNRLMKERMNKLRILTPSLIQARSFWTWYAAPVNKKQFDER
jgi:hypothetical protein